MVVSPKVKNGEFHIVASLAPAERRHQDGEPIVHLRMVAKEGELPGEFQKGCNRVTDQLRGTIKSDHKFFGVVDELVKNGVCTMVRESPVAVRVLKQGQTKFLDARLDSSMLGRCVVAQAESIDPQYEQLRGPLCENGALLSDIAHSESLSSLVLTHGADVVAAVTPHKLKRNQRFSEMMTAEAGMKDGVLSERTWAAQQGEKGETRQGQASRYDWLRLGGDQPVWQTLLARYTPVDFPAVVYSSDESKHYQHFWLYWTVSVPESIRVPNLVKKVKENVDEDCARREIVVLVRIHTKTADDEVLKEAVLNCVIERFAIDRAQCLKTIDPNIFRSRENRDIGLVLLDELADGQFQEGELVPGLKKIGVATSRDPDGSLWVDKSYLAQVDDWDRSRRKIVHESLDIERATPTLSEQQEEVSRKRIEKFQAEIDFKEELARLLRPASHITLPTGHIRQEVDASLSKHYNQGTLRYFRSDKSVESNIGGVLKSVVEQNPDAFSNLRELITSPKGERDA